MLETSVPSLTTEPVEVRMAAVTPISPEFLHQDLTGLSFGHFVVIGYSNRAGRRHHWLCRCICGTLRAVETHNLKSGNSGSCGCQRHVAANATRAAKRFPGYAKRQPEYPVWAAMVQRCYNPRARSFAKYGAKGIEVCDRWRFGDGKQSAFRTFLADMGRRPSSKHSIDRIDNQRGYDPGNCRWATAALQTRNRTITIMVIYRGREMTLPDACEEAGLPHNAVRQRYYKGWDIDRALTQPLQTKRRAIQA